jgi:DNA-binding transcriptional LysR family regulator
VVFRTVPLGESSLTAREISPFRLVACAPPPYIRAHGEPMKPSDLQNHECLGHAHSSQPADYPWRLVRHGKIYEPKVRSRLRVNDAKALLSAAIDGFGIVFIVEGVVRQGLASGELVGILPD